MSSDMRQVTIYLTAAQRTLLRRLRIKTGAPTSESIRRVIDDYLGRQLTSEEMQQALTEKGGGTANKKTGRS
jgi:hypothetical protein